MSIQIPQSFTVKYDGQVNTLLTNCDVSKHFIPDLKNENHPQIENFIGLWDTGATNSVISKNVVDKLGLVPISIGNMSHAGGDSTTNIYIVNIILPNNVGIHSLRVAEGNISCADVLIGMDIISQGDFTICLQKGKTVFSFQIPSTHNFNFVEECATCRHINNCSASVSEPVIPLIVAYESVRREQFGGAKPLRQSPCLTRSQNCEGRQLLPASGG